MISTVSRWLISAISQPGRYRCRPAQPVQQMTEDPRWRSFEFSFNQDRPVLNNPDLGPLWVYQDAGPRLAGEGDTSRPHGPCDRQSLAVGHRLMLAGFSLRLFLYHLRAPFWPLRHLFDDDGRGSVGRTPIRYCSISARLSGSASISIKSFRSFATPLLARYIS